MPGSGEVTDVRQSSAHRHRAVLGVAVAALWMGAVLVKGAVRPSLGPHASEWLRMLLDVTPSLVGGLSLPLCFLAFHPRPTSPDIRRACIWSSSILVIAEGAERFLPGATFDWRDLAASLLGVGAAGLLMSVIFPFNESRSASVPHGQPQPRHER